MSPQEQQDGQIAATIILVKETDKFTLRQNLQVIAPNAVEALLRSPPECWLSNARITQYQALLPDQPKIKFIKTSALNPVTLLPDDDTSEPLYDCQEILEKPSTPMATATSKMASGMREQLWSLWIRLSGLKL